MTPDLNCYGDDIRQLADLAGDFDLRSAVDVSRWYAREWQVIADPLGFRQPLASAPTAIPIGGDLVITMNLAGLAAFERALQAAWTGGTDKQGHVQTAVLQQMAALGLQRGELWRVSVDPTTLTTGACYPDQGRMHRAFYPDTAPGYFGDGWPGPPPRAESACGWTTPLVLHLGTFPWVYSTQLEVVGAGARWGAPTAKPALEGLQVVASLMEPCTNLRQDARQVAAIYRHFVTHTAPLVARVPTFVVGQAQPGVLYRRGALLHVHQGSLHVAYLHGPRGRIAAVAYNYVLRRFANFFAVRRAAVRALATLTPDVQQLARDSADPCLRQHAQETARAS